MKMTRKLLVRHKTSKSLQEVQLRQFVREILTEEVVSITRESGESEIWDVTMTDKTISKSERVNVTPDFDEAIEVAKEFTTQDKGTILRELIKIKNDPDAGGFRQPFPGPEKAAEILQKYWIQTALWPSKNRKGAGEAAFHMAFETTDRASEPDAIIDSTNKFSIKSFGTTNTTAARSGGQPSADFKKALTKLAIALRLASDTYSGDAHDAFTSNISGAAFTPASLREHLQQFSGEDRDQIVKDVTTKKSGDNFSPLDEFKRCLIGEHGSLGVFAFWLKKQAVEYISLDEIDKIGISAVYRDKRVAFLPAGFSSFETVLGLAESVRGKK